MGTEILGAEGHEVVTVDDGRQALAYLRENQPDLVLADTNMPGAGGLELCGFLRSHAGLHNVKFVLLQPPLEQFDQRRADDVGADGVLHKPLDARALIDTVASLLELNGTQVRERPGSSQQPVLPKYEMKPPATIPEPPQPADPFAQAVAEALAGPDSERRLRDEICTVATQVLETAVPALADRITERVVQKLQKG